MRPALEERSDEGNPGIRDPRAAATREGDKGGARKFKLTHYQTGGRRSVQDRPALVSGIVKRSAKPPKKRVRKMEPGGGHRTAGAAFARRRAGRRRDSGRNLLGLLALVLLIALFLARRLAMTPGARQMSAGAGVPSASASGDGSGERLTPADRQSLDQVIRDKTHP